MFEVEGELVWRHTGGPAGPSSSCLLGTVSGEHFLSNPDGQESLYSRKNETESVVKEGEAYQRKEIGIYQLAE